MSREEDALLKEVDEDLQYEKQIAFLKDYGPWLAGAAALLVVGVGGYQVWGGMQETARNEAAGRYAEFGLENAAAGAGTLAGELTDYAATAPEGYAAIARIRAGLLQAQAGDITAARAALEEVYSDAAVPQRLADFARLRAAFITVDVDPDAAYRLASAVETEALQPLAQEITGVAALKSGDFTSAYAIFRSLETGENVPQAVQRRAGFFRPLADAGMNGVPLEAQMSEAESFIDSFSTDLEDAGVLGGAVPPPPSPPEEETPAD